MFVGHYGVSFAAKARDRTVPLWVLFVAVQLLDVAWAPLVLLGIERVRIVPGITASNPLDLYYMPYTHSFVAALLWAVAAYLVYRLVAGWGESRRAALAVAVAVFSHWVLDLLVHRPDLPLYDDAAKVGLGLWDLPVVALTLEAALLFGGMWLYLRDQPGRRKGMVILGAIMLAVHAMAFFGAPPASGAAAALMALTSYIVFALAVGWLEARQRAAAGMSNREDR